MQVNHNCFLGYTKDEEGRLIIEPEETLEKILQNEKYIGDALLQKINMVDFLSKKRVKDNGIVSQYYAENSHEPIIPRDLYMQVQEEMARRAYLHSGEKGRNEFTVASTFYQALFTAPDVGIFIIGLPGTTRGKHSIVWRWLYQCGAWTEEM